MKVTIGKYRTKKKRKIKVRIDNYDTWNAGDTLALIAAPLLRKWLEAKLCGAPRTDFKDVPKRLRPKGSKQKLKEIKASFETDKFYFDRWKWIVGEMLFALESAHNNWEDKYYASKDYDSMRVIEKRIANGYRLFGKYFQALWD